MVQKHVWVKLEHESRDVKNKSTKRSISCQKSKKQWTNLDNGLIFKSEKAGCEHTRAPKYQCPSRHQDSMRIKPQEAVV